MTNPEMTEREQIVAAVLAEREACIEVCEQQKRDFLSEEYATPQPLGSIQERFAVDQCIAAIRDLPVPIAPAQADPRTEVCGLRPEVLSFAHLMEQQLRGNDHKPGWKNDRPVDLMDRVFDEVHELEAVVAERRVPETENNTAKVGQEAADVANFAMMIADVCGALESIIPQATPDLEASIARLVEALRQVAKIADEPRKDWSRVVGAIARQALSDHLQESASVEG